MPEPIVLQTPGLDSGHPGRTGCLSDRLGDQPTCIRVAVVLPIPEFNFPALPLLRHDARPGSSAAWRLRRCHAVARLCPAAPGSGAGRLALDPGPLDRTALSLDIAALATTRLGDRASHISRVLLATPHRRLPCSQRLLPVAVD